MVQRPATAIARRRRRWRRRRRRQRKLVRVVQAVHRGGARRRRRVVLLETGAGEKEPHMRAVRVDRLGDRGLRVPDHQDGHVHQTPVEPEGADQQPGVGAQVAGPGDGHDGAHHPHGHGVLRVLLVQGPARAAVDRVPAHGRGQGVVRRAVRPEQPVPRGHEAAAAARRGRGPQPSHVAGRRQRHGAARQAARARRDRHADGAEARPVSDRHAARVHVQRVHRLRDLRERVLHAARLAGRRREDLPGNGRV